MGNNTINKSIKSNPYKKSPGSLAIKISIAGFLLSLIVALIVGFTFYIESEKILVHQVVNKLRLEGRVVKPLVSKFLHTIESDVIFLSKTPPIQGVIKAIDSNDLVKKQLWTSRFKNILIEF